MKKILGLTISALLVLAIAGGGTWAYFSDTEASTGNSWSAGTLNLVALTDGTGPVDKFTVTPGADGSVLGGKVVFVDLVPGDSGSITWTLTNTGSVEGDLTMAATAGFSENAPETEPEHAADGTDAIGLGQKMMVRVTLNGVDILGTETVPVAMSGLEAILDAQDESLVTGSPLVYVLNWSLPLETTGNEIQGDSATLDITFTLTQA